MPQARSDKPLSEQTLEELLETARLLKLELLKNVRKSDEVTAELLARARGSEEPSKPGDAAGEAIVVDDALS